jgi:ADP-ribosylglycohydrolase
MLGGALGDALGFPIARDDSESMFNSLLGGRGVPESLPIISGATALVSDETQMTLFTAEGLIRAYHRGVDRGFVSSEVVLLRAYQRWLATQDARFEKMWTDVTMRGWLLDIRGLHMMRKPSRTCLSALAETVKTQRCPTIHHPPNASDGPEALVRSAPIGLAAASAEEAFDTARDAAVITNGHPSAYLAAACFAAIIWHLARGARLGDAIDDGLILLPERDAQEIMSTASIARSVGQHGVPSRESIEHIGRGDTAPQALGIALLCARGLRGSSEEAIRTCLTSAARHAGASDATASVSGSLIGAMHGVEALPPQWLAELEFRDVIEELARDLHATFIEGATPGARRYPPN